MQSELNLLIPETLQLKKTFSLLEKFFNAKGRTGLAITSYKCKKLATEMRDNAAFLHNEFGDLSYFESIEDVSTPESELEALMNLHANIIHMKKIMVINNP